MGRKSITQAIKSARGNEFKKEVMLTWSSSLARQTDELTRLAWNAAQAGNMADVTEYLKELRYLITRAMDAVPRITDELLKSTPEISGEELKTLDEMAEKRGLTRADLMREALDDFLKKAAKSEMRREKMKIATENIVKI